MDNSKQYCIKCDNCNIVHIGSTCIHSTVKVLAHWVRNFHMRFSYFSYLSSFHIKTLATDVKMQKIESGPIFFMTEESFGGSV